MVMSSNLHLWKGKELKKWLKLKRFELKWSVRERIRKRSRREDEEYHQAEVQFNGSSIIVIDKCSWIIKTCNIVHSFILNLSYWLYATKIAYVWRNRKNVVENNRKRILIFHVQCWGSNVVWPTKTSFDLRCWQHFLSMTYPTSCFPIRISYVFLVFHLIGILLTCLFLWTVFAYISFHIVLSHR